MTWNPRLHPRDPDDGRFVEKAGGWLSAMADNLSGHHRTQGRDLRDELDYEQLVNRLGGRPGGAAHKDNALGDIWGQAGYDGPPQVVDRATMDRAVASGWTELYRGVGGTDEEGAQFSKQFKAGEAFPGLGGYGNGTYTMPQWRRNAARGYGMSVMRLALHPDARVVELEDIVQEMRDQGYTDYGAGALDPARTQVLSDVGRYGSAAGYDAVIIRQLNPDFTRSGRPVEWLILNRTALLAQDEDWDGLE